jgi:hypothetical protein
VELRRRPPARPPLACRPRHLRAHLDTVSAEFEARLPKTPWTTDKMTPGVMDRMMRQILPFRFNVAEVHGTWKLNQNKTEGARLGAATEDRFLPRRAGSERSGGADAERRPARKWTSASRMLTFEPSHRTGDT